MRNTLFFTFLIWLSIVAQAIATQAFATVAVKEIKSMEEVRGLFQAPPCKKDDGSKKKKRWVVFDFDNTLGEPDHPQQLASEQWLYAHVKHIKNEKARLAQSEEKLFSDIINSDYLLAHQRIDMKPVEPCSLEYINNAQSNGAKVFVITARSDQLIPATVRQVKQLKLEFNTFASELVGRIKFPHATQKVFYQEGIFFVGDNAKGDVFAALLQGLNSRDLPEEVLYFDDKLHHVEGMSNAVRQHNAKKSAAPAIAFHGFHYRYLDKKVAEFAYDPHQHSRAQLEALAQK
jgi:FMN phosphatase YigB (HAD superfamily)